MLDQQERKSRFVGSLLGCLCGDVLGAGVEMQSRSEILAVHPQLLRAFIPHERGLGYGCYTDDTEMTLALAESLIRCGDVVAGDCARVYAQAFTPQRGYGRSAVQILTALQRGVDWQKTGSLLFSEGSFGNGAAMRIAPVGLVYGHLPAAQLIKKVRAAVWMTHTHSEAIEAAVLQARAIGMLLVSQKPIDIKNFLTELMTYLPDSCLQPQLKQVSELLCPQATAGDVASYFGCGVRSSASWPPAIWAALRYIDEPEEAIIQAVNLGGDSDTIGAMTGALVGALHGDGWVPCRWYNELENDHRGRDTIISAAESLFDISFR